MTRRIAMLVVGLAALGAAAPARAGDEGPVIVIPSRPGIPVVINGRDASYAVVEGDWGLARPGFVSPTVIGGTLIAPSRVYTRRNSYHPKYGTAPERGRVEVDPGPDRRLPEQAESFSRDWSTGPGAEACVRDTYPNDPNKYDQPKPYSPNDPADVPATLDNGQPPFNGPIAPIITPRIHRP